MSRPEGRENEQERVLEGRALEVVMVPNGVACRSEEERVPRRSRGKPTATTRETRLHGPTESRLGRTRLHVSTLYPRLEVAGSCPRSWNRKHPSGWNTDSSSEETKSKTSKAELDSTGVYR